MSVTKFNEWFDEMNLFDMLMSGDDRNFITEQIVDEMTPDEMLEAERILNDRIEGIVASINMLEVMKNRTVMLVKHIEYERQNRRD